MFWNGNGAQLDLFYSVVGGVVVVVVNSRHNSSLSSS